MKLSDLRKQRQERPAHREVEETPNSTEIKKEANVSPTVEKVESISAVDNLEIEEGEDVHATMEQLMGFGSFSSTKGKHVKDNDSLVNRGASRVIKQFKPIRILNRKGSVCKETLISSKDSIVCLLQTQDSTILSIQ